MLTPPQRHDLLFLTPEGRELAWLSREEGPEWDGSCWTDFPGVPAICTGRTREGAPELLRVGFSFPRRKNGVRCRLAGWVPLRTVVWTVTPWEAAWGGKPLTGAFGTCFRRLQRAAQTAGVPFGLFGSSALARATGLPYLHPGSDLDILLGAAPPAALERFARAAEEIQRASGVRVDGEVRIDSGRYLKFRELFLGQDTVLVKGGPQPQLLSRREALRALEASIS
ncbi:MAG: malonate decarboxylase holo-[acyl-carrier-protein] synthase [Lawsonibacter sp.]|nr:malonate decarboxylase holo-[acyl-carrier-protein] synthase [Lawsonibacter sp.]